MTILFLAQDREERVLINDNKPDGLVTAVAVNTTRDKFCQTKFQTDYNLGTRYD